jgi:hypothetical protein
MKWSWKTFGLLLVASFALGIGLAYLLSMIVDARKGPGGPDSTLVSLAAGGIVAPILLAAIGGWRGWSLKPLLIAGAIVSMAYSGNPGLGIMTVIFATVSYFGARKIRAIAFYYLPGKTSAEKDETPRP